MFCHVDDVCLPEEVKTDDVNLTPNCCSMRAFLPFCRKVHAMSGWKPCAGQHCFPHFSAMHDLHKLLELQHPLSTGADINFGVFTEMLFLHQPRERDQSGQGGQISSHLEPKSPNLSNGQILNGEACKHCSIITNIIAFLALLAFLDCVLSWLGGLFDYPQLSFSLICSYVFMPLSFMMGVSWDDSFLVAELIGLKTFLNEFVAYQRLSEFIKRREAGGPEYVNDVKQYISVHSEMIATYALCGFSNIASLGMSIGALTAMAPNKRSDISRVGLRALIAGSVACFMTACIAGMLYIPDCPLLLNTEFNNTNITSRAEILQCCTQLYSSVTLYEPWNVTAGGGFTQSSLRGCCALTPPKHFNCSLAQ